MLYNCYVSWSMYFLYEIQKDNSYTCVVLMKRTKNIELATRHYSLLTSKVALESVRNLLCYLEYVYERSLGFQRF
jgi:hypothetical protein